MILMCKSHAFPERESDTHVFVGLYIICAVTFWYYPGSNIADAITVGCDNVS